MIGKAQLSQKKRVFGPKMGMFFFFFFLLGEIFLHHLG
jgi:hypothetical protein